MRVQALEEAVQMVPCMVLRRVESVQGREEHSIEVVVGPGRWPLVVICSGALSMSITSSGERGGIHGISLLDFLTFVASIVSVKLRIPSRFRKCGSI